MLVPATFKVPPACTFFAIPIPPLVTIEPVPIVSLCVVASIDAVPLALIFPVMSSASSGAVLLIPTLRFESTLNTVVKMPLFFTLTSILEPSI